jgi:hypothetical protein
MWLAILAVLMSLVVPAGAVFRVLTNWSTILLQTWIFANWCWLTIAGGLMFRGVCVVPTRISKARATVRCKVVILTMKNGCVWSATTRPARWYTRVEFFATRRSTTVWFMDTVGAFNASLDTFSQEMQQISLAPLIPPFLFGFSFSPCSITTILQQRWPRFVSIPANFGIALYHHLPVLIQVRAILWNIARKRQTERAPNVFNHITAFLGVSVSHACLPLPTASYATH